jgi:hypothetical protein
MRILTPCLFILASCSAIHETSDKIEESHYALYKQKVLLVQSRKANKVIFTNPANTRYYFLRGKHHVERWAPGDTFYIDDNLEDFYRLRYIPENEGDL